MKLQGQYLGLLVVVDSFQNAKGPLQLRSLSLVCIGENECISFYLILFLSVWIDVCLSIVSIFYGIGNGFFQGELLPLFCPQLPNDSEHLIREVRSNRRPGLLSLDHELDELGLVLPVQVKWEPVVEILGADSPAMRDSF